MHPKEIHVDFEEALKQGCMGVFPGTPVFHDFFHFVQANVKKLGQLGMSRYGSKIAAELNTLWYKPNKEDFDKYLCEFLGKWDRAEVIARTYTNYFRATWISRFSPEGWASCGRPSNSRSGMFHLFSIFIHDKVLMLQIGSGVIEAYNRRLTGLLQDKTLVIDKMTDFLLSEDIYAHATLAAPHLNAARQKETAKSQASHAKKRRTLRHFTDRSADTSRHSASLNVWDLTTEENDSVNDPPLVVDNFSVDNTTDTEDDITNLVAPPSKATYVTPVAPLAPVPPSNLQTSKSNKKQNEGICRSCGKQSTINIACKHGRCSKCCYKVPDYCRPHNKNKITAPTPYARTVPCDPAVVREKVLAAIRENRTVKISFSGGSLGPNLREIKPEEIEEEGNYGLAIRAYCLTRCTTRHFALRKILQIEDGNYTNAVTPQTQGLFIYYLPFTIFLIYYIFSYNQLDC
jgi:hypothetical protein